MNSEAYARLIQAIDEFRNNSGSSRALMDEVAHLTKICEAELPAKFVKLVDSADINPPLGHGWEELRMRLKKLLDIHDKFPMVEGQQLDPEIELLPTFSLSPPDKERVLKLCDQMRKIIHASEAFDVPHKKRLLNRIAAIEKQVYSKKGLFDVVLGGVSDIGETVGKFGSDIKPLTDRITEIKKITRSGSKEYKQLPEPEEVKSLPAPEADQEQ